MTAPHLQELLIALRLTCPLSLLLFWFDFYFYDGDKRAQLFVIDQALLVFSTGVGFVLIGTNIVLANSCEILTFSGRTSGLLWNFASYMQSIGYCRGFGDGIALLGIVIAYPSARLFWRLKCL
ncbi:hypothetical protein [Aeromonas bestiarum]|uniref:Uncharacterized protein n=1 Tax=Aeromonas bestiarum TaxID=105751 RepID=A0ABT7Q2K8_9GAMM|nr:hypothetical protein [Aeromonas bestiarum]MDM5073146.1 hypothetical protein [Aeromonas bestiarum]